MENTLLHLTDIRWLWQTLTAILSITIIDLVLSGDNAAVIGLAIRGLPYYMQKKAAIFGAGGAIVLRITFTIFAVYLLSVKYLSAIGGVILIFITFKLLSADISEGAHIKSSNKFWSAVGTIIIADISMAFDNVMGVAGAAHGEVWLVVFGLFLSIPILVWGSTWLATMMGKHPIIIYIGATVLAHTAVNMIFREKAFHLIQYTGEFLGAAIPWICALPILIYGAITSIKRI
ncbi:TerC family protein [Dehalobacterium formicoaceticum]|uniref:TerC family protein n=1 Tax=Dehalobacterium formicoaceticum TaxID=51515 RepID=A0ABT1Y1K6_9FIRM|nr:TerC family protein [Dehalobacterium formicoaceticum]MCR6544746.1 TerC family protein [Dehalobacterium formicoaceticum]